MTNVVATDRTDAQQAEDTLEVTDAQLEVTDAQGLDKSRRCRHFPPPWMIPELLYRYHHSDRTRSQMVFSISLTLVDARLERADKEAYRLSSPRSFGRGDIK
jgi:hypothetical protein